MLHLKKVLRAKPKEHTLAKLAPMLTSWGEALDPDHVLEEHPNPQFMRENWHVLNGRWQCAFIENGHKPTGDLESVVRCAAIPKDEAFNQEIVVPFSPEALLSGVNRQLQPNELLWYRRVFDAPKLEAGQRLLLHFQAVDYACAIHINGQLAGSHVGGYIPFALDISGLLTEGPNELTVCVADPSELGGRLRGKQRIDRGDIWYTAQSGIWQSVWMEVAPLEHIEAVRIEADDSGVLAVGAHLSTTTKDTKDFSSFQVEILDDDDKVIASAVCKSDSTTCAVALRISNPRLWSPDDPYLYHLRFTYGNDIVSSYCAFREIEIRNDEAGHKRVFLNGKPLPIKGVLDQGYWSDGLMTTPADEALVYDIETMRTCGFNMLRKHIKVEAARWYYHCDRLGMLVLQDMVNGGSPEMQKWQWSRKPTLFKFSWNHMRDDTPANQAKLGAGDAGYRNEWTNTCREAVELLANHPCIIGWSLMNEGWGQFDARKACSMVRALDPTRVIDATSGWYDQGCGDFYSVHNYFRTLSVWHDRRKHRAFFISEFGGLTHRIKGHSAFEETYGYEFFDNINDWRHAIRDLLAHIDSLEEKGLAGSVYTQLSDIEEETNGILTYDRRINKLDTAL